MTLSDTEFRKVSIKGAGALPTRTEMLKFHNANISRWEIEEEKPAFHRKTEPVEGGAYVSIEKYFREEGLFHEANRVLIDRVRRSTRMSVAKEWSRPRTVLGWTLPAPIRWLCALVTVAFEGIVWLVGEFVGHGTRPWPSLVAIIVVFLWSTSTFLDPINVDAAPALRARLVAVEPGEIHPGDGRCPGYCSNQPDCLDICSNWGVRNAVTLAARYNVPLAGATVDDIWRPSLRVSQAARLISFSNWIFWPLFLGTLARYVLRRL